MPLTLQLLRKQEPLKGRFRIEPLGQHQNAHVRENIAIAFRDLTKPLDQPVIPTSQVLPRLRCVRTDRV